MDENNRSDGNKKDVSVSEEGEVLIPHEREKNLKPPEPIDYWLYFLIGFFFSLFNIYIIQLARAGVEGDRWEEFLWGYLAIIFLVLIPAIIMAVTKRVRGYSYIIGYFAGGIAVAVYGFVTGGPADPYFILGLYTLTVALLLFLLVYIIFWKIWRSVGRITIK